MPKWSWERQKVYKHLSGKYSYLRLSLLVQLVWDSDPLHAILPSDREVEISTSADLPNRSRPSESGGGKVILLLQI